MTMFFAMVPDASGDAAPAFFLREKQAPKNAVEISDARHRELLEAQSLGKRIVAGKGGRPRIETPRPIADERRAALSNEIKREAARRINAISPAWRQLNDTRDPTRAGAARFEKIDAIREASNAIEASLSDLSAAQLDEFPVRDHPQWPEFS